MPNPKLNHGGHVSGRGRPQNEKQTRPRLLLVCEGESTEPNYFRGLKRFHKIVQVEIAIAGIGKNTLSLVADAEKRVAAGKKAGEPFDEVWCIFDRDSFPSADFDNAVAKCESLPCFHAAWSNESFELWFLLHLQDLQTSPVRGAHGRARDYYMERLKKASEHFDGDAYEKNLPNLYELLYEWRDLAATRAEKLLARCDAATPHHDRKPATTVHRLVQRLLEYAPENQPA